MPRPRNAINKGLPARWRTLHGAYYYQVPTGLESAWDGRKLFRLGKTLPEAYKVWAERIGRQDDARTVGGLLDRYAIEVVPKKAPKSRTENLRYITKLRGVFGEMALESIRPQMIYMYVDRRSEKTAKGGGTTIAHREIELLSHAFTKAVEWGYIDRHPFKGEVRLSGERPRDRYVEDWEIIECLALDSRRKKGSVRAIQAYIRIKLMTGLSRSDLLRLKPAEHFQDDGIHTQRHKTKGTTGKRTTYEWSPELRQAVQDAIAARPALSPYLFCARTGHGYINEDTGEAPGWKSMWQRYMDRVMQETAVTAPFTEHDLRAKCASDADSLEHARALLAHADARTTRAIYRRKPEVVKPLGGVG